MDGILILASNAVVGSAAEADRNIVSANRNGAITIFGAALYAENLWIGLDKTGMNPIPGTRFGFGVGTAGTGSRCKNCVAAACKTSGLMSFARNVVFENSISGANAAGFGHPGTANGVGVYFFPGSEGSSFGTPEKPSYVANNWGPGVLSSVTMGANS